MPVLQMTGMVARWLVARADLRSERGATAVEYAVMVALIAAVIVLAVIFLGREASTTFSQTGECLADNTNC